jgi:hypothetical protein
MLAGLVQMRAGSCSQLWPHTFLKPPRDIRSRRSPGPDLLYLCGYAPIAIAERLTMLVVSTAREPRCSV